ncbi:hypothetical protein ABZ354_25750 [Streptomyces sp. NPDC005925]|uniref:hypothetical protein n=1 Tax=Streptomyces sp. NPDC005925 TaxID=3157172 RepID=UPI0033C64201
MTSGTWSTGAAEDAADAIDLLAQALAAIDPDTARALAAVPTATAALRRRLAPAPAEDVAGVPAARSGRARRRGLGPGWRGVGD